MRSTQPSLIKSVVVTGLIAGTLDAIGAMVVYGASPGPMFQFIASGAFGNAAFDGGTSMIAAGILLHYTIAFVWTILFYLLYPRVTFLRGNKVFVVVSYGIFIWLVMSQVVLRLSRIGVAPFDAGQAAIATAILIAAVSLPIVIGASRYYAATSRAV